MSYQCVKWVLDNSKARGGARNVLLALAEHASKDGTDSWPSVSTLSHEAQLTDRQIHKLLRSLERGAAIRRDGISRHCTTNWTVLMDEEASHYVIQGDTVSEMNPGSGVNSGARGMNSSSEGGEPQFAEGVNSSVGRGNRGSPKPSETIPTTAKEVTRKKRAGDSLSVGSQDEEDSTAFSGRKGKVHRLKRPDQPSAKEAAASTADRDSSTAETPLERMEAGKTQGPLDRHAALRERAKRERAAA
jgi:hypothetical protein